MRNMVRKDQKYKNLKQNGVHIKQRKSPSQN